MTNKLEFLAALPIRQFNIDGEQGFSSLYKRKAIQKIKRIREQKLIESQQIASQILKAIRFMTNNLDTIEANIASQ